MQKKVSKKKKPTKQKIDVVLESLLNLERRMKELIKRIERIEATQYFYLKYQYPERPEPHYWPNILQREDNKDRNHAKPIVGYDSFTGGPIMMDSWGNNRG